MAVGERECECGLGEDDVEQNTLLMGNVVVRREDDNGGVLRRYAHQVFELGVLCERSCESLGLDEKVGHGSVIPMIAVLGEKNDGSLRSVVVKGRLGNGGGVLVEMMIVGGFVWV
ncbi:unnamed protein product [Dovyalis caffra]|uniref:Uncharacterized protein n=1 Tax=Dovyalis caffra TaxID=77055 RepID=A0AAV1QTF9_9ROSI|nr:unnamed protein product [Dovyalis caffra]